MASAARQRPLARPEAIQVDVVVHDHVQQAVTFLSLDFYALAAGAHERHFNPAIKTQIVKSIYYQLLMQEEEISLFGVFNVTLIEFDEIDIEVSLHASPQHFPLLSLYTWLFLLRHLIFHVLSFVQLWCARAEPREVESFVPRAADDLLR